MKPVIMKNNTKNNTALSILDILTGTSLSNLKFRARKIADPKDNEDGKGTSAADQTVVRVAVNEYVEEQQGRKRRRLRKTIQTDEEETEASTQETKETEEEITLQRKKKGGSSSLVIHTEKENIEMSEDVILLNKKGREFAADSEYIESDEQENDDPLVDKNAIYIPPWKVLKYKEMYTFEMRRSFAAHCLSDAEKLRFSKKKNFEVSQGLDHSLIDMIGYSMEARHRWAGMMQELKKKNAEVNSLKKKNADLILLLESVEKVRVESEKLNVKEKDHHQIVMDLEKERESMKLDFEQEVQEKANIESILKIKEEENQRLRHNLEELKKNEKDIEKALKEKSDELQNLTAKHKLLVIELTSLKVEKNLLENDVKEAKNERIWSLREGFPYFVNLLLNSPEYIQGMASVQKVAMAMGQAEASKISKETFVAGQLNEEMMMMTEEGAKELFVKYYTEFNETHWPFVQKVMDHAEAPLEEVKQLKPDGME